MAEVLGIYAFIIAVSISTGTDPKVKPCFLFYGYAHFSRGLAGGMAIGIVGDAGVRARGCLELSSPFLPRIGCPHRSNPSHPFPAGLVLSKLLTIIVDYHGKEAFTTGGDFGPSEEGNRTSLC